MKHLLENVLRSKGVAIHQDSVNHDLMNSKSPEKIAHVIVFTDETKQPHQVIFTGNRVLDIEKVREGFNNENLYVDMRFYSMPEFPKGNYQRAKPLTEEQGCITLLDESLMFTSHIHIPTSTSTMGIWIPPKDLRKAYPNALVKNVTEEGNSEGLYFGNEGELENRPSIQTKNLQRKINEIQGRIKPIVFASSRKEILLLSSMNIEISAEEVSHLINYDFSLFPLFCSFYYQVIEDSKINASTIEMIEAIGIKESFDYLSGLVIDEESYISGHDVCNGFESEIFKSISMLRFIMKSVVIKVKNKYPDADPQIAANLAALSRYPELIWRSLAGKEGTEKFLEELKSNPHRFSSDIQEKFIGFSDKEVSKFMLRIFKFPILFQNAINNQSSPIYKGEDAFYSNLLYVSMSYLVENEYVEKTIFSPIDNMHTYLAREMDILTEIKESIKELKHELKNIDRLSWRFDGKNTQKHKEQKIDRVDAEYYEFRH